MNELSVLLPMALPYIGIGAAVLVAAFIGYVIYKKRKIAQELGEEEDDEEET